MGFLNDFYLANHSKYNIFMVYITEAHATPKYVGDRRCGVWPIGRSAGTINYLHENIEDRSACAKKFRNEYNVSFPIYLDNMENDYETEYSCWPFRYHVILNKKMSFVPMPVDCEFILQEMIDHIEQL